MLEPTGDATLWGTETDTEINNLPRRITHLKSPIKTVCLPILPLCYVLLAIFEVRSRAVPLEGSIKIYEHQQNLHIASCIINNCFVAIILYSNSSKTLFVVLVQQLNN